MNIKTKFNVGDTVYYISGPGPVIVTAEVIGLNIRVVDGDDTEIKYSVVPDEDAFNPFGSYLMHEDFLYTLKEAKAKLKEERKPIRII